jgi:hypothetical protein
MGACAMAKKLLRISPWGSLLLILILLFTVSFSPAEIVATAPLGTIVVSGYATIGDAEATTGTTIFAGDQVTSRDPALIHFISGSRIEMTKATAEFDRHDNALAVNVNRGLIRFSFNESEAVQINAGDYRFTSAGNIGPSGELGLNRSGQIVMNIVDGAFTVLNTVTGKQAEVNADSPFAVVDRSGKGSLSKDGQLLTDDLLALQPNELRGKCVVVDREAYAIKGNTATELTIIGTWDLSTGNYLYKVVECTEEAMIQAGASEKAAKDAVSASVFGVPPMHESHTVRNAAIVAGVGGAVGLTLAIKYLKGDEPSPSSQ